MARPVPKFNGFIGQRQAVAILQKQISGAKTLAQPLPPIMFSGPSGLGKTFLAQAVAAEMGTASNVLTGQSELADIVGAMRHCNVGDILFIDECHNLPPKLQELFYPVIDEHRRPEWAAKSVPLPNGGEGDPRAIKSFTVILATDKPSQLLNALRKRMTLWIVLEYYTSQELRQIVDLHATKLMLLTPQAANRIAEISRGLPRNVRHHLQNLRRHLASEAGELIGVDGLGSYLRCFGIHDNGLTSIDRRYLEALRQRGCASLETLSAVLGQDRVWVRQQIEDYLLRMHFIVIGPRGRELTSTGQAWLRTTTPPAEECNHVDHDSSGPPPA
jgi:Holliday junction DNA helicase RuvB